MHLLHRLFDHTNAIRPLGPRIHHFISAQPRNLFPQVPQRMVSFFFPDLEFPFGEDLGDDCRDVCCAECGLEIGCFRDLAFGDVCEYVCDLEDFVDVFFATGGGDMGR